MEATKASKLTRYVAIISFLVISTFGISKGVGRAVFILLLLVTHEFSTGTIVASYSGVFNKALLLFSSGGNAVALLCVLESLQIPLRENFYHRASPTIVNWKVQQKMFSDLFFWQNLV